MKTIEELKNRKVPIVTIDSSLDQFNDKVLFPEKLAKANKILRTVELPKNKHLS